MAANFGLKENSMASTAAMRMTRRVIDLGEREDAGVFAVGRVGGRAEQGREGGGQAVAHQSAVQARVFDVVAVAGGGDRGHVADVLDHGGEAQRDDGDHGGQKQVAVEIIAHEQADDGALHVDGQRDPFCFRNVFDNILTDSRIDDDGQHIGADDAEEDRDDLDHALAPDVAGDDDGDGHDGDPPVLGAVVDGGGGQIQADGDDDRARDDRREEAHDLARAERFEQGREDDIHQARAQNAEAGVGEHLKVGLILEFAEHRGNSRVAAEERERGTEERGDFAAGDEVEQERAETGEQQRGGDVQTRQDRDKDSRAEHGEHVLEAQQEHPAFAQRAGIIDAFFGNFVLCHNFSSLFSSRTDLCIRHKKRIAERKHRSHNSNTSFMKENTGPETRPPQIKTDLRGLTEAFSFIMARTSFRVLSPAIICAFSEKCNCGFCHISGSMGGDFCEQ